MKLANSLATAIMCLLGASILGVVLTYGAALIWFDGDLLALKDAAWYFKQANTDTSISREIDKYKRQGAESE